MIFTLLPAAWPKRHTLVMLSFLSVFICYIDRVNISVAIIPMAKELDWDLQTQGLVLSSFFVGYLLLQIAGGRMADYFGGKLVLGVGVIAWSLFTLLTPPAALAGLGFLLLTRMLMGMGEAVTFPSIYNLYAKWLPLTGRSRSVGFTNSGIPSGTLFALIATPWVVNAWGWEWAFYSFGLAGLVWWIFWHFAVTQTPLAHPQITKKELAELARDCVLQESSPKQVPWRSMLSSSAVWAVIVAHFCNNWSLYVLLSWLPTFVNKGLGVDFASVGWLTMIPHLASFICLNFAGALSDRMVRSGMPVIRVRKIMQTTGFGGLALALSVVGYVDSAIPAIAIMSIGTGLGAFIAGGFAVSHLDIAPRYAGTLMGITNTAGTLPGIIGVYLTGLILQATGSWVLVFQLTAAITLFGLVFFLLFAKADRQFD